jgi:hypothetical protein
MKLRAAENNQQPMHCVTKAWKVCRDQNKFADIKMSLEAKQYVQKIWILPVTEKQVYSLLKAVANAVHKDKRNRMELKDIQSFWTKRKSTKRLTRQRGGTPGTLIDISPDDEQLPEWLTQALKSNINAISADILKEIDAWEKQIIALDKQVVDAREKMTKMNKKVDVSGILTDPAKLRTKLHNLSMTLRISYKNCENFPLEEDHSLAVKHLSGFSALLTMGPYKLLTIECSTRACESGRSGSLDGFILTGDGDDDAYLPNIFKTLGMEYPGEPSTVHLIINKMSNKASDILKKLTEKEVFDIVTKHLRNTNESDFTGNVNAGGEHDDQFSHKYASRIVNYLQSATIENDHMVFDAWDYLGEYNNMQIYLPPVITYARKLS